MLTAAIAATPRMHPAVLAVLATAPSPRAALALLTNRQVPAESVNVPVVHPFDVHWALPHLRPQARAQVLSHGANLRANAYRYADLTPQELTAAADAQTTLRPAFARALVRNPATPPPIAERALRVLLPDRFEEFTVAQWAIERNVDVTISNAWGRSVYLGALQSPSHIRARKHWASLLSETTSTAFAEHAINQGHVLRSPEACQALASNARLPGDLRTRVMRTGIFSLNAAALRNALNGLSATHLAQLLTATDYDLVDRPWHFLTHPDLDSATLDTAYTAVRTKNADQISALVLALHPNLPPAHRTETLQGLADIPPSSTDTPTAQALLAVARAVEDTSILDAPLPALRDLERRPLGRSLHRRLSDALENLTGWDPTPDEVLTLAALEGTFTGTVTELLATAHAIAT